MSKVTGGTGITDDLESAAREIRDEPLLDAPRRARMRRRVLATLVPKGPGLGDRLVAAIGLLAVPAPYALRALAVAVVLAGVAAGTTVAAAGSLPDEPLYPVKLAAEQVRLALATTPEDRATVQLSLAEHRLAEAEQLAVAGRASATLIASSAYGEHLANAAAELASVESLVPKTATLVTQLASRLADQQARSAQTAAMLVRDPRTERAGAILATVAQPTAAPAGLSAASRIAESAARVAEQLATVAESRAREAGVSFAPASPRAAPAAARTPTPTTRATEAPRVEAARARAQRTITPRRTAVPRRTDSARRTSPPRPTATPRTTEAPRVADARPALAATGSPPLSGAARQAAAPSPTHTATPRVTPTVNPRSAKEAVEKARQAAERARRAAEKAKEASKRTAAPRPTPQPRPTAAPTPRR